MKTLNRRRKALASGGLLLGTSTLAMLVSGAAHAQQVINDGDNMTVTSAVDGETITAGSGVTSTVDGAPVVVVANNAVTLNNSGTLATTGVTQTVQVNQGTSGTVINNALTGRLEGQSRVINVDGRDVTINNDGVIIGTGSQRNGAVYGNRTSNNININNSATGVIDAGVEGAAIAIEVGGGGNPIGGAITNDGIISGRGQAPAMGGTAGDGIRFFGPGVAPAYIYEGTITNNGVIESESLQGTVAAIRFADRIGFQGELNNNGTLVGEQNGLYFGDADHTGGVVNNDGQILSGSRALNIDGEGLVINNRGVIAGLGNQRNGTVYADSTAQNFTLNNDGAIDVGLGNNGAGFSAELSAEGNDFTINNTGAILGDGNADAGSALAGDGIRFERGRVNGMLDGSTTGLFTGTINNSETGAIAALGTGGGTTAGIRFVNGVSFSGTINNDGFIGGTSNGLYFGNATPAGGGDFTGAVVNNNGTIESESRAVNIDGLGLTINNAGSILGAGNQRNGTVYADSTAQGFTLNNLETGVIDAGMGNEGAGFSVELSTEGNDFTIVNAGTIQGRGQASAGAATAGDGLRFERERVGGILDGSTTGLFTGTIENSGLINSESADGTTAGIRFVNGVSFQGVLNNSGTISGVQNGVYFGNPVPAGGADHTGGVVNNLEGGVISSDSRAFNIDGTGLVLNNAGSILGTGNQRNGTVYADGTADNFVVNNDGVIDAGEGNEGSGFGAEIGGAADGANTFDLVNTGTIRGRGQADAATGGAGDGVRIGNVGNIGVFDGTITNSGLIDSESMQGTTAGIRFVNGISFQGTLTNEEGGVISGVQNGLYFGNPVMGMGADHTGGVVNNLGTISSGSRALNIDGIGLTINNAGSILGTGNQRNGTVYADSTAQGFTLNNTGTIDAGMGNEGAGFSVELASAATGGSAFDINNDGVIQGRGNAAAGAATAGDGLRFERSRNMGVLDGTTDGLFVGNITNTGTIDSEAANGTAAGIRFVNGVSFQGVLDNSGTISGVQNGLYFGNPTPAGGGDFTQAIVNNSGTISSGSRALNIDGNGLTVNNSGSIIGTGAQRNGTVYSDITAQNFTLNNEGLIDAGMGNEGAGFSAQLASAMAGGNTFTIANSGTIQGRGNASAGAATAGDGLRFERTRNAEGMLDGTTDGLFIGDITNSGTIASEGDNGTVAGIRFVNGISYRGTLTNTGTISGVENGLYFGNPVPAGGGDFSQAIVNNSGVISSGSRAVNIDGTGLRLNNLAAGRIIGTGNQRNGTVYADGTANGFTITNAGLIDAGMGNAGSGVSLQLGAVDGDMRNFTLTNSGTITGRGAALPSGANAGVRLFSNVAGVSVTGNITNSGTISSTNAAGLLVENVAFNGTVTNTGTITGAVNAVDASNATAALNFVQNGGALNGNFVGSAFADRLTFGTGPFALNSNILNGVAVTTNAGSVITVNGARSINGSLTVNGTLNFDLGTDVIAVTGNTVLGSGSRINIATDMITAADIGRTIDVLTDTGTFTNNGALINVADNDFLIDYSVVFGSVAVTVNAADLGDVSADANINSFGSAITTASRNNRLPADVFAALNGLASASEFEAVALTLLPAVNDGVAREIYETQRFASSLVQNRLRGEGTGLWGQAFVRSADADATSISSLGYDADATGFTLGLDTRISEDAIVGVLLNYSDIDVEAEGLAGALNEINAIQLGVYAGFDLGGAYLNGEIGYSTNRVDGSRIALGEPITGESDIDGLYASANLGYDINAGGIAITPSIGLRYADLSRDTFTENGGLGLTLESDAAEFVEGRAGVRVASAAASGLIPYVSVDYAYDFSNEPIAVAGSFNGGADTFRIVADEASASRFDVGAGVDLVTEGNLSVGVEYRGRFASDYQSHAGGVRIRFAF